MSKPTGRGGPGRGQGRKPGRASSSASITLPDELWAKLDAKRGILTRSAWIAEKIRKARQ